MCHQRLRLSWTAKDKQEANSIAGSFELNHYENTITPRPPPAKSSTGRGIQFQPHGNTTAGQQSTFFMSKVRDEPQERVCTVRTRSDRGTGSHTQTQNTTTSILEHPHFLLYSHGVKAQSYIYNKVLNLMLQHIYSFSLWLSRGFCKQGLTVAETQLILHFHGKTFFFPFSSAQLKLKRRQLAKVCNWLRNFQR